MDINPKSYPKNILLVHNYYQQPGGEDVVFRSELALLRDMGHSIFEFTVDNDEIKISKPWETAFRLLWSTEIYRKFLKVLDDFRPDVAHFHNFFPLISPSAYYACQKFGVPVVQTLHNYRLMCPVATFYRDGKVCEDCLGSFFAFPGVRHACYRQSHLQSAGVATMTATHRMIRTWRNLVSRYIALTNFSRQKFIQGGLPARKIDIKPNFVVDFGEKKEQDLGYALYVGRLSPEKGISTILRAWEKIQIPLKLVGDGPLREMVQRFAVSNPMVEWLGFQPRENVIKMMKQASMLILASEWYENMPVTMLESFSCGLPVVASRLGGMAEMIEHEKNGLLFEPGNQHELAQAVQRMWRDHDLRAKISGESRKVFEEKYTPSVNYAQLLSIYQQSIAEKQAHHKIPKR